MNKKTIIVALIFSFVLTGCASQSGWRPVVDPYNDPGAQYLEQDYYECDGLARQVSGNTAGEAGRGALVGGAIGAAMGAVFGAIFGDPGSGAAIGASIGGFQGGTEGGFSAEQRFQRAYVNCMRNRGHNVID